MTPQKFLSTFLICFLFVSTSWAQEVATPVFVDGEAQEVAAFKGKANQVLHDLFVETEFDSDGNGTMDRMHVAVARPIQTDTQGLKVPVVYETSPYFAGTAGNEKGTFWDPKHEIGETPPDLSLIHISEPTRPY